MKTIGILAFITIATAAVCWLASAVCPWLAMRIVSFAFGLKTPWDGVFVIIAGGILTIGPYVLTCLSAFWMLERAFVRRKTVTCLTMSDSR